MTEIRITSALEKFFLIFKDAKIEFLNALTRLTNNVMVMMFIIPMKGHFVMSHFVGKVAALDDPKLLEDGESPVNSDGVDAPSFTGMAEKLL